MLEQSAGLNGWACVSRALSMNDENAMLQECVRTLATMTPSQVSGLMQELDVPQQECWPRG